MRNRRGDASKPRRLQKTKKDDEEGDVCVSRSLGIATHVCADIDTLFIGAESSS